MRWPDACRLIDRIREERPELTVDHYAMDALAQHYALRICCLLKGPGGADTVLPFHLAPGSIDTIYGVKGWEAYRERHPHPWCRPEESYHTDALGREVDHRGRPVVKAPPTAEPISAEAMLSRLILLNRADPDWYRDAGQVAAMAAAWGVRVRENGVMADYESEEVARLSGDTHASVLIARTGSGLVASGYAARWGDGGFRMEPSVLSVPFDSEPEARRAALRELIATLEAGRRNGKREALLAAVRERQRDAGLFG